MESGAMPITSLGAVVDGEHLCSIACFFLGANVFAEAIDAWHANRNTLILCLLVVLITLRAYLHSTEKREDLVALPQMYGGGKPSATKQRELSSNHDSSKRSGPGGPRRIQGRVAKKLAGDQLEKGPHVERVKVLVFFSSVTTTTEKIARDYLENLRVSLQALSVDTGREFLDPDLLDLTETEFDDYFVSPPDLGSDVGLFYLFLLPSYNIDTINDTFLQHLQETHHDFRIDTAPLSTLFGYSVFGFGDKEGWPTECEGFCFQAKEIDKWMAKLTGRKRAYPVGMGDMKGDFADRLQEWASGVHEVIGQAVRTGYLGDGLPGSGAAVESEDETLAGADDGEALHEDDVGYGSAQQGDSQSLNDLEDLGRVLDADGKPETFSGRGDPLALDFTTYKSSPKTKVSPQQPPKEMVAKSSPTYAALTKQGYSIVGSHSGVKICRWTKSALRGRGSCYKFSLYGINSHQCMETTPSLSCSNKCVFCWRHGTNPVGTTWRWVVDPPDMIFEGVKENHYKKIKMMRGMPGVRAERYSEALRIRHCALSLVGEPIFYPHINEFLALLHGERISSFLVCNAQHPDQLAALKAVTQLYVSIDASNRESLRKIDRPLHRDFWERFQKCLDILREKRFRHRTVYRLTLVKGFNVEDEAEGYAQLVERGLPCFVEVKGVTYCGTSTSSNAGLSMSNVPFYWEVCDFARALEARLRERGLEYGIAAEHAHSCCILLASERFRVDGKWHTHIDYDRFFELLEERGPDGDWTPEDYMGPPTPEWALWGHGGFDPRDDRVDRKGRKIEATVVRERPADFA